MNFFASFWKRIGTNIIFNSIFKRDLKNSRSFKEGHSRDFRNYSLCWTLILESRADNIHYTTASLIQLPALFSYFCESNQTINKLIEKILFDMLSIFTFNFESEVLENQSFNNMQFSRKKIKKTPLSCPQIQTIKKTAWYLLCGVITFDKIDARFCVKLLKCREEVVINKMQITEFYRFVN